MRAQTSALLEEDKTTAEFKRERRKVPLTGLLCFCFVSAQAPFINRMSLSAIGLCNKERREWLIGGEGKSLQQVRQEFLGIFQVSGKTTCA